MSWASVVNANNILNDGRWIFGEYFEAILRNDCIEKRDKMLQIDDFNSSVVEIFLRHLYNGALPYSVSLRREIFTLMRLADKYNANELFDSMDSYFS